MTNVVFYSFLDISLIVNIDYIDLSLIFQEKFDKSLYRLEMSFWTNVSNELEFQGISRKELSYKANIKEMTIHKAIERDSVPSADTALRIAKALNVSLEFLLDMTEATNPSQMTCTESEELQKATKLYRKYNAILNQLEKLSRKELFAVGQLIETLAK